MAKANEHGRLIAAAAKAALAPLGCVRKGQSRVWYSDQRYWVIAVEFQPSGWSKGSLPEHLRRLALEYHTGLFDSLSAL
jgi:hypothetical protein